MALIKCKDCGHDMSDRAVACPYCGCPNDNVKKKSKKKKDPYNNDLDPGDEMPYIFRGQRGRIYHINMW